MPGADIDIDEKLGEIEEKLGIPKKRLYEVYKKILVRLKSKAPNVPIERKKRMAYSRLRYTIKIGYPISFCPDCPHYYTNDFRQLRMHLKDKHNWGPNDLNRVRKGFFKAKNTKRLDYRPRLP